MSLSSRRGRFLDVIGGTSFPFAWKFKCGGRSLHPSRRPLSRATHSSLITVAKLHCHSRANSFDFSRRFFDDCCVCQERGENERIETENTGIVVCENQQIYRFAAFRITSLILIDQRVNLII